MAIDLFTIVSQIYGCFLPRDLVTSHFINLYLKMVFQYLESTACTLAVRGVGRLWANKALEGQDIVHKQWLAPPPPQCFVSSEPSDASIAVATSDNLRQAFRLSGTTFVKMVCIKLVNPSIDKIGSWRVQIQMTIDTCSCTGQRQRRVPGGLRQWIYPQRHQTIVGEQWQRHTQGISTHRKQPWVP